MKKHFFLSLCSLLLFLNSSQAGFERIPYDARARGLGLAVAALKNNPISVFFNIAGLATNNQKMVAFDFSRPFGMKELDQFVTATSLPTKWGNFSLGFSSFGFELYKEHALAFGFSRALFANLSLGITFRLLETKIKNYSSDHAFACDVGFLLPLTDELSWGFYASNLNRAKFYNNQQLVPQNFSTGVSYQPLKNLLINIDIFKEITFPTELRTGIEYIFRDKLSFRTGIISEPANYCFGLGFRTKYGTCDYAAAFHSQLGTTHQFSIKLIIPHRF